MTIAPRTPFLPTSRHYIEDQSLLIDAELTFDESFEAWLASPRDQLPIIIDAHTKAESLEQCSTPDIHSAKDLTIAVRSGQEEMGRPDERDIADQGPTRKRALIESPQREHGTKKTKVPTPIRNDFYSRRVKDADRRSSLGLTADMARSASQPLYRSISRDSIRSSTSSSTHDRPRPSISSNPALSDQETSFRQTQSPLNLPNTLRTPDRSSLIASITHLPETTAPLQRTESNLSNSTSNMRDSLSGRVTGFLTKLIRRSSSIMSGVDQGVDVISRHSEGNGIIQPEEGGSEADFDSGRPVDQTQPITVAGSAEESEVPEKTCSSLRYNGNRAKPALSTGPRLRLPPPLTRPAAQTLATSTRALLPKQTYPSTQVPRSALHPLPKLGESSKGSSIPPSTSRHRPLPSQSKSGPSFTSRALSRLPGPGKGSSSSSKPIVIRATERAPDLSSKRETFERLAREAAEERERSLAKYSAPPSKRKEVLKKTIPVKGNTPGKASRQRAEERARFEQGLKERHEEKRKRDEQVQKAREEMERAEDKAGRDERIVWAKGLPAMYAVRAGQEGSGGLGE